MYGVWDSRLFGEVESYVPWQRLYFLPLLQGHFSLRPILRFWSRFINFFSSQVLQVQAGGCSEIQLPHRVRLVTGHVLTADNDIEAVQ